jgi:transcription elongation factor Elf1
MYKNHSLVVSKDIDEKYLSEKVKSLSCGAFLQEDVIEGFSQESVYNYFVSKIHNLKNALEIMDEMIDDAIELDNWSFRQKYNGKQ